MAIEKTLIPLAAAVIGAAGLNAQTPTAGGQEQSQSFTKEQIREIVRGFVSENSGVPVSQIKPDQEFTKHLGMDSLDYVMVIMEVERRFGITMPDEMLEEIKNVGKLEEWVEWVVLGEK